MSSVREDRDGDEGSRRSFPVVLALAAFVLTALPLAVASALPPVAGVGAFDIPSVAVLIGTISL